MSITYTVVWILAHPDTNSLNHALFRDGIEHLREQGVAVTGVDLYAEEWNPLLTDSDTVGVSGSTLSERQHTATTHNLLPDDVARQQQLVTAADIVIVQFPLWWYAMPAILKGWFDRVFTNGFAFGIRDDNGRVRKYGDGGLVGRRLLPIVTAGDRPEALGPRGISGHITEVLWPLLHGTAHYTGMVPLEPHLLSNANCLTATAYLHQAKRLRHRLDDLGSEHPLTYRNLRSDDYTDDHQLDSTIDPAVAGLTAHLRR
jgi:NAD(P)H dehydrogenase (quinone)